MNNNKELFEFAMNIITNCKPNVDTKLEIIKLNDLKLNRKLAYDSSAKVKESIAELNGYDKEISEILNNNNPNAQVKAKLIRHKFDKKINKGKLNPETVYLEEFEYDSMKSKYITLELLKLNNLEINKKLIENANSELVFNELINSLTDEQLIILIGREKLIKNEALILKFINTRFNNLDNNMKQRIIDEILEQYLNKNIIMRNHLFIMLKFNNKKENIKKILDELIKYDLNTSNVNIDILYNIIWNIDDDLIEKYLDDYKNKNLYIELIFNLRLNNHENVKKIIIQFGEICKKQNREFHPDIYNLPILGTDNKELKKFIIEYTLEKLGNFINVYELIFEHRSFEYYYRKNIDMNMKYELIEIMNKESKIKLFMDFTNKRNLPRNNFELLFVLCDLVNLEDWKDKLKQHPLFRNFNYNEKFNLLSEEKQIYLIKELVAFSKNLRRGSLFKIHDILKKFLENVDNEKIIKLVQNAIVSKNFI